jgi:hypothetical protein
LLLLQQESEPRTGRTSFIAISNRLNVMVEDDVDIAHAVKILDFGLAKIKSGELLDRSCRRRRLV